MTQRRKTLFYRNIAYVFLLALLLPAAGAGAETESSWPLLAFVQDGRVLLPVFGKESLLSAHAQQGAVRPDDRLLRLNKWGRSKRRNLVLRLDRPHPIAKRK
jgi:hypothetical protein